MNKKFKYLGIILCLSLVCATIFTTKVFANNYGTGEINLSLDFGNIAEEFTIESVTVNGDNWHDSGDMFATNDGQYTIVARITSKNGDRPRIVWGGNWNGTITSGMTVDDNLYTATLTISDARNGAAQNNQNNPFLGLEIKNENQGQGVEPGPDGPMFDGKAYLIWSCGENNSKVCMHFFENIPDFNDGNSKFYKDVDIVDQIENRETHERFSLNAEYNGWATPDGLENWKNAYRIFKELGEEEEIDWNTIDPEDLIGEPLDMRDIEKQAEESSGEHRCTKEGKSEEEFHDCVNQFAAKELHLLVARAQLKPLDEPEYNNAYVSYGDRNFKTVVYNSDYKGVRIGSLNELNYYPSSWNDPFLKRDQYDISGTSQDKPTTIDTVLLEDIVTIREVTDKDSNEAINGFQITNIEPLDVPEGTVTVTKDNNGDWKIKFSSNFYDNVTFKVTDSSNGNPSYFNIKRSTVDCYFRDSGKIITATFYYAKEIDGVEQHYTDYDLTAKIVYKDGSEKNVKLEPVERIDDGLGNITEAYEVDEEHPVDDQGHPLPSGKGLKKSVFEYNGLKEGEDRTIQDIFVFIEFKGSDDTTYAGALSGSGKGVPANIYHPEEEQ